MQGFTVRKDGWFAHISSEEALLLAQGMEDLASMLIEEENRVYLRQSDGSFLPKDSTLSSSPVRNLLFENPNAGTTLCINPQLEEDSKEGEVLDAGADFSVGNYVASEEEVLAALDFEPLQFRPPPAHPALAALLRPLSQDEAQAGELRALTLSSLCQHKAGVLSEIASELRSCGSREDGVLVTARSLPKWLTALNDMRLATSGSLGIKTEKDSLEVNELANAVLDGRITSNEDTTVAVVYVVLSWWQESLLDAVQRTS